MQMVGFFVLIMWFIFAASIGVPLVMSIIIALVIMALLPGRDSSAPTRAPREPKRSPAFMPSYNSPQLGVQIRCGQNSLNDATPAERILGVYKQSWSRLAPEIYAGQNIFNIFILPGHEIGRKVAVFDPALLEDLVVEIYKALAREYKYTIGLPYASSTEFVAALCIAFLDDKLLKEVAQAIDGKFSLQIGAMGMSDAFDVAVKRSNYFPLQQWHDLYHVLQHVHPWVQSHQVFRAH